MRKVAIVVHEGVEVLDFTGPGEVFSVAFTADEKQHAFEVFTVSETTAPIISQGFLKVQPTYGVADCPKPDIVVVPGGDTRRVIQSEPMMAWLRQVASEAEIVLTVCSGAFAIAHLGLLDGKEATTWWGAIERLRSAAPNTRVHEQTRFVDNGQIITTAGVSAGIDGALRVVSRLVSPEMAAKVARYMEYDRWQPDAGLVLNQTGN